MPIPRIRRFAVECSCLSDEKNRHLTHAHLPFLSCQSFNRHVDGAMASIVTHSIYLHSISVRVKDIFFYLLHTALRYLPLYYNTAYNGYSLVKYS